MVLLLCYNLELRPADLHGPFHVGNVPSGSLAA